MMKIDYKVEEKDFLIYQLFVASKSERIKKKRQRNKVLVPLFYAVLSFLFFIDEKYLLAIGFLLFGLLWFFLYPYWERRRYINHYKGFIKENYTSRLGKTATLEFSNDIIIAKDNGSESKVLTIEIEEIEEINEIPATIFVRLKGGQSFILPKDKINNVDTLIIKLKEISGYLKLKYVVDDKWEWK